MPCLEKYICIIHLQNNIPGDRVKYYRSDNKERIHEESNFPSADRHPHGQSLWATCYRQKPQCHSSKLANASETPQENENGSSVHLQETIKGSLWASSPCQGLTTPFPDCHLTRFRIQQNSVAAICSKHPQRRPGKESPVQPPLSLPVPAPAPLKARAPSMATRLILQSFPRACPCHCHLRYFLRLGCPPPSRHKLQPLLPKLLSILLHHRVSIFFLPLHVRKV